MTLELPSLRITSSAVKKVAAYYRATDHTIISVIKLTSTDGAEMALSVV